jgi:hypothetical protein
MIDRGADCSTNRGAIMVFDGVRNLCSAMVRLPTLGQRTRFLSDDSDDLAA